MTTRVYRFSEFQAAAVAAGVKRRTIRAPGRVHAAPGDMLRLTGPRGNPRTLLTAPCRAVVAVTLALAAGRGVTAAAADGAPVTDLEAFARDDGFRDAAHMGEFFLGLHGPGEFQGVMVCW